MTEAEAREFMKRYFHAALQEADLDVYTGLFTEDGVLEDPVGTPPLRGKAAIREFVRAGRAAIARTSVTVREIMVCGDEMAVRWAVEVHAHGGASATIEGIGTFLFDGSGLLRHVKEYYDVSRMAQLFAAGAGG